jgi:NDP-sugar pyrophosphorylase family protein
MIRTSNGWEGSGARSGAPTPTRAVVLAGGLGMRLRPYTMVLPKPLIPIGDMPILEHIIRRLMGAGVRRVDLCLGRHLGALIQTYFWQATSLHSEIELVCHWEDEPLGTAGALRAIEDLDEPFIVMNGDILTTLDFGALMDAHHRSGAALTIAMHRKEVEIDLGVIECTNGSVTGYREKPSLDCNVSMGIYVYDPRALEALPAEGSCQFPDMVLRLIRRGELVAPFRTDATWYDIGTLTEYERALQHVRLEPELFAVAA